MNWIRNTKRQAEKKRRRKRWTDRRWNNEKNWTKERKKRQCSMRSKTYTYTYKHINNVVSIKTVLNQCYYNPYYHRTYIYLYFLYTPFIHHLYVFLLFHQRPQRKKETNVPTASLYTHRYIEKLRGVSYLLCMCTSFTSISRESSALNKI